MRIMMSIKELLYDSIIFRGVIAALLVFGYVIMEINQIPISDTYQGLMLVVVGYFFGAPTASQVSRKVRNDLDSQRKDDWVFRAQGGSKKG